MKRTEDYFNELKLELASFPNLVALASDVNNAQELLQKLTTSSPVANWDLMTWVQAFGAYLTDQEVQHTLAAIADVLRKQKYGSAGWYVEESKKFQLGDTLTWDQNGYRYDPVDLSARIVTHAATVSLFVGLRLKVAKSGNAGLEPLSPSQLAAFTDYWSNTTIGIKPAGINLIITSGIADLLKMSIRVVRNPQVLAADGSSLSQPTVFSVIDAINNYIQFLPFNNELKVTKLEDAIQSVEGVLDVEIDSLEYKYGAFSYQPVDLGYLPDAGYARIDPLFPLSSSITYLL
jgi:hypothetical protein